MWACKKGAIAVEAALIMPVIMFLMLGVIDYSLVLFTQTTMQSAAREGARQLAVRAITPAAAPSTVATLLPGWAKAAQVTATQSATPDGAASLMTVKVNLPATSATPIGLTVSTAWILSTSVTMRLEPAA